MKDKNYKTKNSRRHQKMEKFTMYLEQQSQRHLNAYVIKSNIQTQCDPNKNINDILLRNRKYDAKFYLETQETGFQGWNCVPHYTKIRISKQPCEETCEETEQVCFKRTSSNSCQIYERYSGSPAIKEM